MKTLYFVPCRGLNETEGNIYKNRNGIWDGNGYGGENCNGDGNGGGYGYGDGYGWGSFIIEEKEDEVSDEKKEILCQVRIF